MSPVLRPIYSRQDLQRVLAPSGIALVGASASPVSLGHRALENLRAFSGKTWLVNARHEHIGEQRCYPSISALPESPDCVVLAIPRDAVESAVLECARIRAGGVVIFASGYAETGLKDRIALQRRLADIGQAAGMRIIGPNTTGFANHLLGAHAGFAEFPGSPLSRPGTIGVVTQSGALALALSQAVEHGASISHVLPAGNSCDVDVADYVSYLADEPACRAIVCVFEGLSDPQRLFDAAAKAWAADKPLIVQKLAVSSNGAATAKAHTGSRAGSTKDYHAGLRRAGAVLIDRFESLIETATFFAKAPRPQSPGVAVVAGSGGSAILAADKAKRHGVSLPQPREQTRAALQAAIPDFGSARNPCDATAQVTSNPESLRACAEALLSDPDYGALMVPWGKAYRSPLMKLLADAGQRHGKVAGLVWMSHWTEGPGALEAESEPHLVVFRSMDNCFATLAAWHRREALRSSRELDSEEVAHRRK